MTRSKGPAHLISITSIVKASNLIKSIIDQGRHSIVPFYAQGSKKVYHYNFYCLQAVFFCCGLGIPALCEELKRTNHWHKNTSYSTVFGRWIAIRIGVESLVQIRIRIEVKIQDLYRSKMKPWRASEIYNRGVEV
jgi:hypothetical protein